MLFNSTQFWFFFVFIGFVFFGLPQRFRWVALVIASYYFYMCWKPVYAILLAASTVVDYSVGQALSRAKTQAHKKIILCASLLINFGALFAFKYSDFVGSSLEGLFGLLGMKVDMPHLHWLLPVGISFYTFQSVSYTIDVYRGSMPAEKHFGIYAAYVTFFPQLVAGPINRAPHLLPQFREEKRFTLDNVRIGLRLALWGMFKKVCVADLLASVVNTVYESPTNFPGPCLLIATIFFAIQIYCDFSGYSDIALGVARILGFELMTNFRQPYYSSSIAEFWQRWHISLSTWFRDYLYFPLGGSRVSKFRWCLNLMIVFLVSGLWHGANWTFIIWGALHGVYLVGGVLLSGDKKESKKGESSVGLLRGAANMLVVFAMVTVGWVFFRANSVSDAFYVLRHAFSTRGFQPELLFSMGIPRFEVGLAAAMIAVLMLVDGLIWKQPPLIQRFWNKTWFRWGCYASAFYAVIFFGVFGKVQFIYFQF
ncbi:MAG TPA: MBOAT family O-acyltransferase [Candidatus Limnocylindria bacterium]|jgi:D-alanyl-lipoteichoic acid acyltransferase DltB (MBOAT superfamily)|nr:MBOAT family O-acyltransferase [Candidatus Limnocylindria bacterium]